MTNHHSGRLCLGKKKKKRVHSDLGAVLVWTRRGSRPVGKIVVQPEDSFEVKTVCKLRSIAAQEKEDE